MATLGRAPIVLRALALPGVAALRGLYLLVALPVAWVPAGVIVPASLAWLPLMILGVVLPLAAVTVARAGAAIAGWPARAWRGGRGARAERGRGGPRGEQGGAAGSGWPLLVRLRALASDPAVWLTPALAAAGATARLERILAAPLLGQPITSPYGLTTATRGGPNAPAGTDPAAWRDAAYLLLSIPLSALWASPIVALGPPAAVLIAISYRHLPDERISLGSW